jgi:hypothetical protein
MAEAMADVHAVDHAAWSAARADSEDLGRDWLHDIVREMVADTKKCHRMWQRRYDRTDRISGARESGESQQKPITPPTTRQTK